MARTPTKGSSKARSAKKAVRSRKKGAPSPSQKKTAAKKAAAKKTPAKKAAARKATVRVPKQASARRSGAKTAAAARTPAKGTAKTRVEAGRRGRVATTRPETRKRARTRPSFLLFAPGLESFVSGSSTLVKATEALAHRVAITVAPTTVSNEPIQAQRGRLRERSLDDFRPRRDAVVAAVERLKQLGLSVEREGRFAITASGPAELVADVLKIRLTVQARPRRTPLRATQNFAVSYEAPRPEDLYVAPAESLTVRANISEHIDDFVFIPPPLFFAPISPTAPSYSWHGVDRDDIRRHLRVPPSATGEGIKVGIVDTGFFRHPYYAANGLDYQPTPTPTAPNPENDPNGHGTAIALNVFAVAPRATVMGFQHTDPPQGALEEAADAGVDIISCSWGWDYEQSFPILEATIRDIVSEGKIVLFAAGNGHQAWPGSMPEVLSIGGVYADAADQLEASNYASGFMSNLYPPRRVPDVSGLCGQKPRGVYIMMPCPPGCSMDQSLGNQNFPDGDGTHPTDGWVGASGTSSATPQVAGVAALLLQKARAAGQSLDTDELRNLLQSTAVPVQRGHNAQGFPATGHPNIAVGYGLVDATAALGQI